MQFSLALVAMAMLFNAAGVQAKWPPKFIRDIQKKFEPLVDALPAPLRSCVNGDLDPSLQRSIWHSPEDFRLTNGAFDPTVNNNVGEALLGAATDVLHTAAFVVAPAVYTGISTGIKEAGKAKSRSAEPTPPADVAHELQKLTSHQPAITATVPLDALRKAMSTYEQVETWSCGPHATGRARIILGWMSPDELHSYVHRSPTTITATVGPTPSQLAAHAQGKHKRFNVGELVQELRAGRPVVVLIKVGGANLHYQTVVGVSACGQYVAVLDTNNTIAVVDVAILEQRTSTWLADSMIVFG